MKNNSLHIIKNFDELATTPARASLLTIAEAGYTAIETAKVIQKSISLLGDDLTIQGKTYNLREYEHIYVLGVGKCAVDSALELEAILGERISEGVVVDVRTTTELSNIQSFQGSHPYPSEENVLYTSKLLALAEKATAHDLVLIIVSGGGSTLLCQPNTHTFSDESGLVHYLFKAGATIEELNTIRKHLSKARGGFLATVAHPATVVSLLFSDVPGDDVRTIASSPTVYDESTLEDAKEVFAKYQAESSGFSIEHFFETPKDKSLFAKVRNVLVLKNTTALEAMKKCAENLGYNAEIKETKLQGEARVVGVELVQALRSAKARTVHLYGGETTVTITGPGKGGRNEELSLSAIPVLDDDELVVSLASDGRDNTEFAGGIADKYTRGKAEDAGLNPSDYLFTNDSYTFFHSLQQGIITGYTGANVADLVIAIKHER
jgi:glycerate-2-kinase